MKRITAILCVIFTLITLLALPVGASTPYQTYTYSIDGIALHSPDAYTPTRTVDSTYMGLNDANTLGTMDLAFKTIYDQYMSFGEDAAGDPAFAAVKKEYDEEFKKRSKITEPSDIEVDADGNIYIVDTGNSRLVVLNRYYRLKKIISRFENHHGIYDALAKPKGVYVTPDKVVAGETVPGKIYVCDTNNNRIVTFNHDCELVSIIAKPESQLFGANSVYMPIAVAVDNYDRLYVVSENTTEGIIVMTEEGVFTGFIGAQKVSVSAFEKLWRRFQTEEQKLQAGQDTPPSYNNITLTEDFIYITTDRIEEEKVVSSIKDKKGDYAPVKMLNAAGDEIMRRNGFFGPSGEVDTVKVSADQRKSGSSMIVDVAVGPEKTWSIIDQKRSKVFTYDFDGNLLFAFGDEGRQLGNIKESALAGIVYQEEKILLLNKTDATFTVYDRTEYGDTLAQALRNQNNRQNDKAITDWKEILKRNSNFDAAYIGIGKALYQEGEYEESLTYFAAAYDTENYSNSYKELRTRWFSKYIWTLPLGVVAICLVWSKFMKYAKKVNKRVAVTKGKRTYGQELIYVFHVIFHPFDGFWDLKHEKRGSVRAGATILVMVIATFYYQAIGKGYILNPRGTYADLIGVILSVALPLGLWIVANWCLTTLFDGEGSLKDIFIASTYALLPLVLLMIPTTIASNFILANEANMLSLLNTVAFIWVGMLLFFGMMVTHDYGIGKNVLTTLGTILGMICIMFIAILFTTLLGKLVSFVTNIVTEIQYRM